MCFIGYTLDGKAAGVRGLWLGIMKSSGLWVYSSSQEQISYGNWVPGNPSGDGSCTEMLFGDYNYGWNDLSCSGDHINIVICEKDL